MSHLSEKRNLNLITVLSVLQLLFNENASAELEIRCKQFHSDYWGSLGQILTCADNPSFLIINQPEIKISKIVHTDGSVIVKPNEVDGFYIDGAKDMKFMPRGIKKQFPQLKAIAIWNSGLSHLDKNDMKEFGSDLIHAGFLKNSLQMLSADLFEFNPNLKMIRFDENPLKFIDSEFFRNLKNLNQMENALFAYSNCIDQNFKSDESQNIKNYKWNDENCHDESASKWMKVRANEVLEQKLGKLEILYVQKYLQLLENEVESNLISLEFLINKNKHCTESTADTQLNDYIDVRSF